MGFARTNRFALGLLALSATGCQGSTNVSFAGALVFSVTGTGITTTVPSPCEVDVDFGVVPLGRMSTAIIQIENETNKAVTFGAFTSPLLFDFALSPSALPPLAAGASTQLSVSFGPPRSGEVFSSFSVPTDLPASVCGSASSTILVKLSSEGAQLSLSVAPTTLDFGTVLRGESAVETVTLTNDSTVAVNGLAAAVTGTDASLFAVSSFPVTLAAGASESVQVTYSPMALEKQSEATVTFGGAEGEIATLSVSGRPVGLALSLAPNPIDFGYVPLGTTPIGCTTVSNAANVAVTIFTIADFETDGVFGISDVDGSSPPKSTELPTEVPGHGSVEVCFTFTPLGAMQYTGQLTLVTNDPNGSNPVLQLTGWGGGPQITCTPTSLDFGSIEAFTSKTLPVLCTNSGSTNPLTNLLLGPPTASPAVFSAQFDQTIDPYPLNGLDPGGTTQVDVSYSPTSTASVDGEVVIRSNGGQGQPAVIPVSGQGLPLGQCQLNISPTALHFGSVAVGQVSTAMSFEIQNVGTDLCVLNGAALDHDFSSSFIFAAGLLPAGFEVNPLVLPPQPDGRASEMAISMAFAPTIQGALSADLTLSVLNPNSPVPTIALTGTGE